MHHIHIIRTKDGFTHTYLDGKEIDGIIAYKFEHEHVEAIPSITLVLYVESIVVEDENAPRDKS